MPALDINASNHILPEDKGHAVSSSPWGYHANTIGGRKNKKNGKSYKNKRRSRYTRQTQNKCTTRKCKNKK